jgi:hypothetical protein
LFDVQGRRDGIYERILSADRDSREINVVPFAQSEEQFLDCPMNAALFCGLLEGPAQY